MTKSRLTFSISFIDSQILAAIMQPFPIFGGKGEGWGEGSVNNG